MNRINSLFKDGRKDLLSIYFCAGATNGVDDIEVLKALERNGVDMVEIGIPFSDPLADGPVIQDAATKALKNGMSLKKLLSELENVRSHIQIPLILMGYLNPIMQYGFERLCQKCSEIGIDGFIIPDLPFDEYIKHYKPIADKYCLKIVMLITPETSEERIRLIDEHTNGFIYMVSSAAITGAQKSFEDYKLQYFKRIDGMRLKNPRMIGFGISNRQTFEAAKSNASGAIIGSKFVKLLEEERDAQRAVSRLLEDLKN